jgi:hypothetical protein
VGVAAKHTVRPISKPAPIIDDGKNLFERKRFMINTSRVLEDEWLAWSCETPATKNGANFISNARRDISAFVAFGKRAVLV